MQGNTSGEEEEQLRMVPIKILTIDIKEY